MKKFVKKKMNTAKEMQNMIKKNFQNKINDFFYSYYFVKIVQDSIK